MNFTLEKSITINAPRKKVMNQVTDFALWKAWSPWLVLEPTTKVSISGNVGEAGHTMSWEGELIGSGVNTLTEAKKSKLVYELEFLKPFKSTSSVTFRFQKSDKGTKVIWSMVGSIPPFLFFMIPLMQGMLGLDFERGLKMLKSVCENGSVPATTKNKGIVEIEGFSYVGIQRTVHMDEIGQTMPKDFDRLIDEVVTKRGKSAKHWISLYPKMDMKTMIMTYIAAVSDEELESDSLGDEFVTGTVNTGTALEIHHKGPYDFIGNAWSMGMMYVRSKKIKQNGTPFEYYWNSPHDVEPEKLETSVYFPVKN